MRAFTCHPERYEILRFAQNDKGRGCRMIENEGLAVTSEVILTKPYNIGQQQNG